MQQRVAIVTGAASGIGKAIALRLAADGFHLALNDLPASLDNLSQVATLASQSCGINTIVVPGDVSSEADVENMVEETVKRLGGVDAMIANAGIIGKWTPITELTTEQWDEMFAVHARGAFLCYKHAIRQMIKQGRGGRIVGACSLSGLKAKPNHAHYNAAKFAIRGLTQSVALEVGKHGITVNAYAPGLTITPMVDELGEAAKADMIEMVRTTSAMGREGQPDDVANVVSFLLSEKSGYITGQTISVSGGMYLS